MKKSNLFYAAVAAMFFTACSSDEMPSPSNDNGAVQEICLQVSNTGDGLKSRAGRELLSEEAGHSIENVVLFICNSTNTIVKKIKYSDWQNEDSKTYDNGRETTIKFEGNQKLSDGTYNMYAIGYSKESDYNLTAVTTLEEGGTFNPDVVLSYKEGKSTPEEIFAGSVENFKVVKANGFKKSVVLNRQVAGAYIYVYNIPMTNGLTLDTKIRLVASDANNQLVLGNFANLDISSKEDNTGKNVNYVVNGAKSGTPGTVICEARIGDWYKEIVDKEGAEGGRADGILDAGNNWKVGKVTGGGYVKGSIFASNFVIPFKKVDEQTLTLQIINDDDTKAIRSWNVNLQDTQLSKSVTYWNGSAWAAAESYSETKNYYSILRNHLYSVGRKLTNGEPGDNNPDPDPTPNPDVPGPEDLSKTQELTLRVNHNWEVIHRMELE